MRAKEGVAVGATMLAVAIPMLVVHWVPLGQGLFAQLVALLLWGVAIAAWATVGTEASALGNELIEGTPESVSLVPWAGLAPLLAALGLVVLGVLGSALARGAPAGVWAGSLVVVLAAAGVAIAGACATRQRPEQATRALMWGVAAAASASLLIAVLQLAAPGWANSLWVAPARTPGRASANLLQPNHLATLLLWGWIAVAVWPARRPQTEPAPAQHTLPPGVVPSGPAPGPATSAGALPFMLAFAMQAGVAATASRAGLVASLVLAVWAALDRRLPRPSAWLLWITALGGLAITLGRVLMAPPATLGAGASLVRPGARGGVFLDSMQLIGEHPIAGVGWMEFPLAWSLSALGDRGPRYYEHPHNIVLNLIVELGVPLGVAICACLIWGAWRLLRTVGSVAPAFHTRALMLAAMLASVGMHSLFDAPFWVAYLLLPAAWAWGCLVGLIAGSAPVRADEQTMPSALEPESRPPEFRRRPSHDARVRASLVLGGIALAGAALGAWMDFRRVLPPERGEPKNASHLFSYYADHQAALGAGAPLDTFRSARWVTIDTELLAAWIAALEREGRHDEARYLMQRALEFRDPAFGPWLAACRVVAPMEPPSRCRAPARLPKSWRDFR